MKPTLYIAIEVKNREIESQALLALKASLTGYRVYVGTHAAILNLLRVKESRGGIFLDKGTLPLEVTKFIKSRCEVLAILDQELGPFREIGDIQGEDNLVGGRVYPGVEEFIDFYFTCNKVIFQQALEFLPSSVKVINSGWPRFEFQSKYSGAVYAEKIAQIHREFGDYYLFPSDLGPLTPKVNLRSKKMIARVNSERRTTEIEKATLKDAEAIADLFNQWNSSVKTPKLILRPHTSENIWEWKTLIKKYQNLIIQNGEITPWILASRGIIHRGSTSSLQALISGLPVCFFSKASESNKRILPKLLSTIHFDNIPDFSQKMGKLSAARESVDTSKILTSPISGSIRLILDTFSSSKILPEQSISRYKFFNGHLSQRGFRRFIGMIRDEVSYFFDRTTLLPQSKYCPGGILPRDFLPLRNSFAEFEGITVRVVGINLVEVDLC